MKKRSYYSVRTGKNSQAVKLDLPMLARLFGELYKTFSDQDYFQEAFGYFCVDTGNVAGTLGLDIEAQVFRKLRKPTLWPIQDKYLSYSEDDLFDMIEFLFDYVSKPIDGWYHQFSECGWHYNKFDQIAGRSRFRNEINELLCDYDDGYELSEEGEILALAEHGLDHLILAKLPMVDSKNVERRIETAVLKFRRYRSSQEDRRDAIRDLADVLEYLRPQLKKVLASKDESDLFNIANNFGIRHHNDQQKIDYDKPIWYSWMFYFYLATIHAALRLIKKEEQNTH